MYETHFSYSGSRPDAAGELWGGPEAGSGDLVVQAGHRHRPTVVLAVLLITLAFIVVRLLAMG